MLKYCPRCGARALPGARFCRSCGARLEKKAKEKTVEVKEAESPPPTRVEAKESSASPIQVETVPEEPTPVKVELSKEEEESLLVLSQIIPLQKQIEELTKEKDSLEIKFRVEEELSEKEYNSQIKGINNKIEKFTKEIEEKRKVMASLSLINLVDELIEVRERLTKLEDIFKEGRIQESTYDRLKKEYKEDERTTQAKVDEEEKKLRQYRRNLKDEKDQIASMKEELFARYSVGEFSEEEYRNKLSELEARNIEGLMAAVDEVLARMTDI